MARLLFQVVENVEISETSAEFASSKSYKPFSSPDGGRARTILVQVRVIPKSVWKTFNSSFASEYLIV